MESGNVNIIYSYSYYGLNLKSSFVFPELEKKKFEKPDVVISVGRVMARYSKKSIPIGVHFESHECYIFKLADGLLIQVENGASITVEHPGKDAGDVSLLRLYLLSTIFNAILHQRGMLLLHASVACRNNKSIAIAGDSGAGKSTTAAELCLKKQFSLIADDTCAISFVGDKKYQIKFSTSKVKILPDAFKMLQLKADGTNRISANSEKIGVSIREQSFFNISHLAIVFVLQINRNRQFSLQRLRGVDKAEALLKNTFWRDYLRWMGRIDKIFEYSSFLARDTEVFNLHFDKHIHPPLLLAAVIEEQTR